MDNHKVKSIAYMTFCLLLAAPLLFFGYGCSQTNKTDVAEAVSGTLTVGVREAIPGFSNYDEITGKCYGLEIDIATELASRLTCDVAFETLHAEDREEALMSGKVDCLIATMTITDERKETMDFSPAYYEDETVLLVQNSTGFDAIADLAGATVGIVEGSSAKALLDQKLSEHNLQGVRYIEDTIYEDLITSLEIGDVDAVCLDGCVAQAYLTSDRSILEESLAQAEYGVATVKGSELSEPIATTIQEMIDDGTIESLIDKWD